MDIENAEKLDLNLARQWLVKKIRDEYYEEDSENAQNALVFLNRYSVMKQKLVHCKDCKKSMEPCNGCGRKCSIIGVVDDDFYCGWGERK